MVLTLRAAALAAFVLSALGACTPSAPEPPANVVALRNLDYAGTRNARQTLDVYIPRTSPGRALPLVVFIHGGAWEEGSKLEHVEMVYPLVASGEFVAAAINYRLTDQARHPAQIHDSKGAIRWLRAHAGDYGIDRDKIAVFGLSAGGHLASLLGTSGGVAELEGEVGGNRSQDSRVSCVINFCGPADFLTFGGKGSRIDPEDKASAIGKLLGDAVSRVPEIARAASPVTYISADDPPFLHIHGSNDELVPYAQVQEFDAALEAAAVSSTVLTAEKAGHVFYGRAVASNVRAFLESCLLGKPREIREGPLDLK